MREYLCLLIVDSRMMTEGNVGRERWGFDNVSLARLEPGTLQFMFGPFHPMETRTPSLFIVTGTLAWLVLFNKF